MPTWKKVIVSGSNANLTALSVDNLTSGQVVIGGGTSNLSTTAINGSGTIVATTGATGLSASGSFSGSFQGAFTGLITSASQASTASFVTGSNVFGPHGANSVLSSSFAISSSRATTASFALNAAQTQGTLTFGEGLNTGTFNGSSNVTVTVSGSVDLTNNAITKWNNTDGKFAVSSLTDNGTVVSGASSIQLTGASSILTGSFTGSFRGDGSGLTGLVSTLNINAGTGGPSTVALASQTLTIAGTANEVETSVSGQTITVGLPNDVTIGNNLTVTGDLYVNGNTTTVNTTELLVEDKFILLASGSAATGDGGIIIDRGSDGSGNIAFGFDSATDRWGFQNGLTDTTNAMTIGTNGNSAFAGIVFTETAHTSTKPTTGEFVVAGAIYTANDESIWMYS
jgi:hypothetical protein